MAAAWSSERPPRSWSRSARFTWQARCHSMLGASRQLVRGRTNSGRDEARLRAVRPALETLASTTRPDQTLLVVPEGVTLNYLIRRRTPTPFLNFMPPEFAIYGEDAMIHALQTSPPDRVLFVPKPSAVYGMEFGRDYGARLMAWIEEKYSEIGEFEGGEVFRMPFVIRLLAPPAGDRTGPAAGFDESGLASRSRSASSMKEPDRQARLLNQRRRAAPGARRTARESTPMWRASRPWAARRNPG